MVEDDADADAATVTDAVVMLDALTGARKSNASTTATNNSFGINLMMRVLSGSVLVWIDARRTVSHWVTVTCVTGSTKIIILPAISSQLFSITFVCPSSEPFRTGRARGVVVRVE